MSASTQVAACLVLFVLALILGRHLPKVGVAIISALSLLASFSFLIFTVQQ